MTGEHQRHHLVADLEIAEAVAVLVLGVEEQAEDVQAALARPATLADLLVDERVELLRGGLEARPGRAGAAEHAEDVLRGVEGEGLLEQAGGVDRPRRPAVGVEAEERAHGDAESEAARPRVEVDGAAGGQFPQRSRGLIDDRLDRRGEVLAVEGREHDPARAAVEVAVDREQPVAHQADEIAEVAFPPEEVRGVRDSDVVVRLGTEHEDDVAVEEAEREDRPEPLVAVEEHREGFVGEAPRPREREACIARREGDPRGALLAEVVEEHGDGTAVQERRGSDERHRPQPSTRLADRPVWAGPGRRAMPWHTWGARAQALGAAHIAGA